MMYYFEFRIILTYILLYANLTLVLLAVLISQEQQVTGRYFKGMKMQVLFV